jgi:hypothetical protein
VREDVYLFDLLLTIRHFGKLSSSQSQEPQQIKTIGHFVEKRLVFIPRRGKCLSIKEIMNIITAIDKAFLFFKS